MKPLKCILPLLLILAGGAHGAIVWSVGINDGTQDGDGIAPHNDFSSYNGTTFTSSGVQERDGATPLPGNPANTGGTGATRSVDDDYYFAGVYNTVVDGGSYTPVGIVPAHEAFWERALVGVGNADPNLRYHFNVPNSIALGGPGATNYMFLMEFYNLDDNGTGTGVFNLDLWVDGVSMGTRSHTAATINTPHTWSFPVSALGGTAEQGAGFDHYIELRSNDLGSSARWASLDYAQLEIVPEPGSVALIAAAASLLPLLCRRRRRG